MGLVDRQAWQRTPRADQLAEDQKQLERVGRADDQVVVGVLAVVEVEAAETLDGGELGDDLLDVRPVEMVAEVDQNARPLAELLADQQRRAPVGDVGRVKRRLERLVLDEQLLLVGERRVELHQAVEHPLAAPADVVLACIVGAVGKPQRLRARAERAGDLDALQEVRERLAPDARVGVRDRAELVVVVLEEVRVDGADVQAVALGAGAQLGVVSDRVPGEVERDAGCGAGQTVDLGGVLELLKDVARPARLGKDAEARARVAVAPRRRLDAEHRECLLDRVLVGHLRQGSARVSRH